MDELCLYVPSRTKCGIIKGCYLEKAGMTSFSSYREWAAIKSLQISLDLTTAVRNGERKLKNHSNEKLGLLPNTRPICLDTGPGR